MDEYNLKASAKFLGELYPVLLDAKGRVIADGFNRSRANPKWHTVKLEKVDTPEKLFAAKIIANCARRDVPRSESEKWVNELASHLDNDGHITKTIVEMTGMSPFWVNQRLSNQYKPRHKVAKAREAVRQAEKIDTQTETLSNPLEPPTYTEVPDVPARTDQGQWVMNEWRYMWDHRPTVKAVAEVTQEQKTFLRGFLPKFVEWMNTWIVALGKEPIEIEGGDTKIDR